MLASGRLFQHPPTSGVPLVDADATITPGADGRVRYVMPPGVQTADRTIIIGNTGATADLICDIIRPVPNPFKLTILRGDGVTLIHEIPAGEAELVEAFFTAGGVWLESIWFPIVSS